MTRTGIVAALTAEARTLARRPIPAGELICLTKDVLIKISGVGPERASQAARTLLASGATALLSWGTGGGLVPVLSSGSLVLPQTIIAADQTIYHVNPAWHERVCGRMKGHLDFRTEPVAESASVLAHSDEKAALSCRTGAIAVDMESAAVAAVAQAAGVPFLAVRVISDPVTVSIPMNALRAVDEFGQLKVFKLIEILVKNPTAVLALVHLGRDFRTARRTLEKVAKLIEDGFLVPEE